MTVTQDTDHDDAHDEAHDAHDAHDDFHEFHVYHGDDGVRCDRSLPEHSRESGLSVLNIFDIWH